MVNELLAVKTGMTESKPWICFGDILKAVDQCFFIYAHIWIKDMKCIDCAINNMTSSRPQPFISVERSL